MRISILLPVFNTSQFLPSCLDSIIGQTCHDWELIAVDDHSSDDSLDILQAYAKKDARIRVFRNNEKGIAPALRLAFGKSSGLLITRMDSDDLMESQKLELLKNRLETTGTGHLATGLVHYFSENGVGEGYCRYATWLNDLTLGARNFDEIYKECVIPSPCWMAWRSDLLKCGAFETDTYPEDYDLCFRFRSAGLKVLPVDKPLHLWRDWSERTSRTSQVYRDNTYLSLKVKWFLDTDHDPLRPLVIWGAGKKGKRIARMLNEQNVVFGWVTNNPEKIGKEILRVEMREVEILKQLKNPQVIVAVAAPDGQQEIKQFLEENKLLPKEHYFFFC